MVATASARTRITSSTSQVTSHQYGITLERHNDTIITHVSAANIKSPFQEIGIPVTMRELSHGFTSSRCPQARSMADHELDPSHVSFSGQFGIIDFDTSVRLPRHVHISEDDRFTTERILVLNGVALVELNGEIYVIPPRTLVTIAPGVPHTWTACPIGVSIAAAFKEQIDATPSQDERDCNPAEMATSQGSFLMVYEYEEVTGFFPTQQIQTLEKVEDYQRYDDLERIRLPQMTADEVNSRAWFVWGREVWKLDVRLADPS